MHIQSLFPWKILLYKISFDLNGQPGTPPDVQNVPMGIKVIKPADPIQPGYAFEGWYKE